MPIAAAARTYPNQIREFVPARFTVLGTDGFGRSDTRANLRRHFEVDRFHIAHAAIAALAADGKMTGKDVVRAIKQYKLDREKPNPITVERQRSFSAWIERHSVDFCSRRCWRARRARLQRNGMLVARIPTSFWASGRAG